MVRVPQSSPTVLGVAAPLITYSFSSRGFPDILRLVEQLLPSIGSAFLLSLFDVWHIRELSEHLTNTDYRVRIWDSGGYETRFSDDISSVISAVPSSSPWDLEHYVEAARLIPWNGRDILVNFDNTPPLSIKQQLEVAFEGYGRIEGNYLRDVLLHVPTEYDTNLLVDELIPHLAKIDIIGFTEKEIAPTWKRGVQFVDAFRRAFVQRGLVSPPIHLFGCLDPKSITYFSLAGIAIFDGLSWLRYFFHHRTTLYRREFEFLEDFQGIYPAQDIDIAISLHNMNEIQQLHADLNYQLTLHDESMFERERYVLQSILSHGGKV